MAAGASAALANLSCAHVAFSVIDGLGVVICIYALFAFSTKVSSAELVAAVELLVCVLILTTDLSLVKERERHLTWWGVVAYGVYLWARARDQQDKV